MTHPTKRKKFPITVAFFLKIGYNGRCKNTQIPCGAKMFMKKIPAIILCCVMVVALTSCKTVNKVNYEQLANELKETITAKYDLDLADNYDVGTLAGRQGYYGVFTDKRDPSLVIQTQKHPDGTIEIDFEEKDFEIRQELYAYIDQVRGDSFVKGLLDFHPSGYGGPICIVRSSGGYLSYKVYVENLDKLDAHLNTDFLIVKKAEQLLKDAFDREFVGINVVYTNDKSLLEKDWIEKEDPKLEGRYQGFTAFFYECDYLFEYAIGPVSENKEDYLDSAENFVKCAKEHELNDDTSIAGLL